METAFSLGDDDSLRTRGRETGYPCQGFSSCHPSPVVREAVLHYEPNGEN